MPLWFVVFMVIWTPILCMGCALTGAYLMYCKQEKVNPLEGVRTSFVGLLGDCKPRETEPGFYEA